jgi:serine/threonine-protein kinase
MFRPPQGFGADQKVRIQRFEREARAASLLNHPHIISIFDANFERGVYYIAMDFVEGRTLRALIAQESRTIENRVVLDLLSQTASALAPRTTPALCIAMSNRKTSWCGGIGS